jgi:two-component system response regulator VicR
MSILIIEDEAALADALKVNLKIKGYQVSIAADGEEAIERLRKKTPDLILSDILLPRKNGFEVLEDLKKNPRWSRVPVIILSNLDTKDSIARAYALGAEQYFIKSEHSIADIIEEVKKCLKAKRKKRGDSPR